MPGAGRGDFEHTAAVEAMIYVGIQKSVTGMACGNPGRNNAFPPCMAGGEIYSG